MNKLIKVLLIGLIAFCVSIRTPTEVLSNFNNESSKNIFKAYHSIYRKDSYDLNSEVALKKYKVFKDNLKYIKETNSAQSEVLLGITSFADLTLDEFGLLLGSKFNLNQEDNERNPIQNQYDHLYFEKHADLIDKDDVESAISYHNQSKNPSTKYDPNFFDKYADKKNKLNGPKLIIDDSPEDWSPFIPFKEEKFNITPYCAQDYVFFAITDLIETNVKYWEDKEIRLSTQSIIDCHSEKEYCTVFEGTNKLFISMKKVEGISTEKDYGKYIEDKEQCKKTRTYVNWLDEVSCTKRDIRYRCTDDYIKEIFSFGPYISTIDAYNKIFQHYRGGYLNYTCEDKYNFTTVLVYKINEKDVEFKTYLGKGWGNNGTAKIRRTKETCGLTEMATGLKGVFVLDE